MDIYLNITFPRVPCMLISMDVMDVSGEHHNGLTYDVFKTRLDPAGNQIGNTVKKTDVAMAGDGKSDTSKKEAECGSCYGAKPPASGCCNTCQEIEEAYGRQGWAFTKLDHMEQCVREGYAEKMKAREKEGCNIHGKLTVNKAAPYHANDEEEEDDDDDDYWNAYNEFDASPAPARSAATTTRRVSPPPAPRADSPPLLPAPISPPPAPAAPAPADSTPAKAMATSIGHSLHFLSFNDPPAPASAPNGDSPMYGVSRDAIKEHVVASATALWTLAARSGMAKEEFLAVVAAAVYSPQ
ncbi:hypothetical protein AMAG_20180 [Allomyces macrogynus ATCC 38327]|uniref:Endoplasmic reticulum vesicle transporter C-terminal domain-containing protein n=1 Tax=Allomyces macrogynus (strain ATCC 38327) TaxID=578462 RepID=A0A0L0T7Z7_ALLM3|nr:hypothetical protein AMAG_20180 [Allomyces macrogynus ATCC 38327]|eukprot:KNE70821.1 hypothetical protein AMAG_20180 [Allomyces macrogynus ATCC 38327]